MDVTPFIKKDQQVIQSYAEGQFRVSGQRYDGPVIVLPSGVLIWDVGQKSVKDLKEEDFQPLMEHSAEIDVVLLGCGTRMGFLTQDSKKVLRNKNISIDTMGTGAACRTYNVLMAEGRQVAAALLPI